MLTYYFTSTSSSMIHHDLHYKKTSYKYNKDHSYISMLTVQAHVQMRAHSRAWERELKITERESERERDVQLKELWQKVMSQLQNYFAPGDRGQQWILSVKFRKLYIFKPTWINAYNTCRYIVSCPAWSGPNTILISIASFFSLFAMMFALTSTKCVRKAN